MSELMSEWMNERMNEWVSEWMSEWVSEWVSEWMNEWVSEWMSEWVSEWVIEWVRERETERETTTHSIPQQHSQKNRKFGIKPKKLEIRQESRNAFTPTRLEPDRDIDVREPDEEHQHEWGNDQKRKDATEPAHWIDSSYV